MVGAPPTTQYVHTLTCAHGQELEAFESIQTIGHGGELAPLLSPTIPTDSLSAWIHMSMCVSMAWSPSKLVKPHITCLAKLLHVKEYHAIVHQPDNQEEI